MSSHLKNIAIIGASGTLGAPTLAALIKQNKHNITIITRQDSSATFPESDSVKVHKGDYASDQFLLSALKGQDVLVLILGIPALGDEQKRLIDVAAKAGVKYVLPTEFGSDTGHAKLLEAVPLMNGKKDVQERIKALGMKFVAVITNPWINYSLKHGMFDINVDDRKATLYTDCAPFNTTTIHTVAEGIAKLLSLPEQTLSTTYANSYVFISSFQLTQPQLFDAVLRATGTTEAEWTIEKKTVQDRLDRGQEKIKSGDFTGMYDLVYGYAFKGGMGGDFQSKVHNRALGLEQEDLDEVVRAIVSSS